MRNSFLALLIPAMFLVVLDGVYRAQALLHSISLASLPVNAALVVLAVALACAAAAVPLGLLERRKPGSALLVSGALLIYVNLVFFKFHLNQYYIPDMARVARLAGWAFPVLLVLAWVRRRQVLPREPGALRKLARPAAALLGLALILLGAGAASHLFRGRGEVASGHVLMLTFDSLASNHMSVYGYSRPTTPNLEKLAETSYVFENMVASSNNTETAMPCFQGRYPELQPDPALLLTERLRQNGYRTAFCSFTWLSGEFRSGFDVLYTVRRADRWPWIHALNRIVGWESTTWLRSLLSEDNRYVNLWHPWNPADLMYSPVDPYPLRETLETAEWVLSSARTPTFLWIHVFQPHANYRPWAGFASRFGPSELDRYDTVVQAVDAELGRLLERVDPRTLLILSADHGESFLAEPTGYLEGNFHGPDWTNEAVARVPLILRIPGRPGGRIRSVVTQVDLAPTLCELLGLPPAQGWQGESLVPYLDAPNRTSPQMKFCIPGSVVDRHRLYLHPRPPLWAFGDMEMYHAYLGPYKVVWLQRYQHPPGRRGQLTIYAGFQFYGVFDLERDPQQRRNLMRDPQLKGLLEAVFQHPVVRSYRPAREALPSSSPSTGGRS